MPAYLVRPMARPVGRPKKPKASRMTYFGLSAYPSEIKAIRAVAATERFRTGMDYIRSMLLHDNHPDAQGKITEPRRS